MMRVRTPAALVLSLLLGMPSAHAVVHGAAPRPTVLDLARWEPDIRAFEEADRRSPPTLGGIVFAGSSSIRLWSTLERDFPGMPVLNRGFGGSQIREVTAFADRIVIPYRPRLIVFHCGSNDVVAGRTAAEVAADFEAFVGKVRAALPRARIIYISSAPNPARWHLRDAWVDLNARIEALAEHDPLTTFVDVWAEMLDESGRPRPELFVEDQLHMNERGYAIWTRVLRPVVEREYRSPSGRN